MKESCDFESDVSASEYDNGSCEDLDDYKLNLKKTDDHNEIEESDSSDHEKDLKTNLCGSYSIKHNNRLNIKEQLNKIKRMKKMMNKQMESLDNSEKVKPISAKQKDKIIISGIHKAKREETIGTIQYKFSKIEKFSNCNEFVNQAAESLELLIYEKCGNTIDKKYSEMAKEVYSNINSIKTFQNVCHLILNNRIGLNKLIMKSEKFTEKCRYLEQKFSKLIQQNTDEDNQKFSETQRFEYKANVNIEYDKIREESLKKLSSWMEKEKLDRQTIKSKLSQHLQLTKRNMSNCNIKNQNQDSEDPYDMNNESTKSGCDEDNDNTNGCSSAERISPQKPKRLVSSLKNKIKEIKENSIKQKEEKKLEGYN